MYLFSLQKLWNFQPRDQYLASWWKKVSDVSSTQTTHLIDWCLSLVLGQSVGTVPSLMPCGCLFSLKITLNGLDEEIVTMLPDLLALLSSLTLMNTDPVWRWWHSEWVATILGALTQQFWALAHYWVTSNHTLPGTSSPLSAAYMCQWIRSTLVQVMPCCLSGAKPLPEPMLAYCQLGSSEQISVEFF